MGGWLVVGVGANPQTSLVSETLFPTSLRSPGVTNVGSPFLLFPEINTFARPYPAARDQRGTAAGSCPVHFLDERISPSTSPLFNAQLADAVPDSCFLCTYRICFIYNCLSNCFIFYLFPQKYSSIIHGFCRTFSKLSINYISIIVSYLDKI